MWRAIGAVTLLGWSAPLPAHDVLAEFVQHDVRLEAGREHLDLTVDLTFFEEASEAERRRMDRDGDGHIRRAELESYVRDLEPRLRDGIRLKLGGEVLLLAPLRPPEVDLLGDDRPRPAHHRLRVAYFCSTPSGLRLGSNLVAEESWWPDWPAVVTIGGAGRDAYALAADQPASALQQKLTPGQNRKFSWRVTGAGGGSAGSPAPAAPPQPIEP